MSVIINSVYSNTFSASEYTKKILPVYQNGYAQCLINNYPNFTYILNDSVIISTTNKNKFGFRIELTDRLIGTYSYMYNFTKNILDITNARNETLHFINFEIYESYSNTYLNILNSSSSLSYNRNSQSAIISANFTLDKEYDVLSGIVINFEIDRS